jgi:MinD-like ATPase involved in chromosome partitioning or flagellar assembly
MKSVTFAISMGGVGKSLLLANTSAALAQRGFDVVVVDTAEAMGITRLLNIPIQKLGVKLDDVVERGLNIKESVYETGIPHLFLIPSGIQLSDFFYINPIEFAIKLMSLDYDYLFVDVPYAVIETGALLSLGVCQYYILGPLEIPRFEMAIAEGLSTSVLALVLKCAPLGFVINKVVEPNQPSEKRIKGLENLFKMPCLACVNYDKKIEKCYEPRPFLAYTNYPDSDFSQQIRKIAKAIEKRTEEIRPLKQDPVKFMTEFIRIRRG